MIYYNFPFVYLYIRFTHLSECRAPLNWGGSAARERERDTVKARLYTNYKWLLSASFNFTIRLVITHDTLARASIIHISTSRMQIGCQQNLYLHQLLCVCVCALAVQLNLNFLFNIHEHSPPTPLSK